MLRDLAVLFLVFNALFWGLARHSQHCKIAKMMKAPCAPHYVHVYVFGLLSFVLALYLKQGSAGLF